MKELITHYLTAVFSATTAGAVVLETTQNLDITRIITAVVGLLSPLITILSYALIKYLKQKKIIKDKDEKDLLKIVIKEKEQRLLELEKQLEDKSKGKDQEDQIVK